jgi:hypothetical protein
LIQIQSTLFILILTEFTLKEGIHFSTSGLITYLNKKYGAKLEAMNYMYRGCQKVTYNTNDIQHYIIAGKLPDYMGGQKIKQVYFPFFEKIIEVQWI